MIHLVSLPEAAYAKVGAEMVARWFPPKGMFFKFSVIELTDETSLDECKAKLLVSDEPVRLTKEEIASYAKYKNM